MALTLDRSTLALDGRKLMLHVGPRPVALALCPTEAKADELHRLFDAGQHARLEVRATTPKIHTRYDLVFVFGGEDIVLAEFTGETDATLWAAVVADGDAVPALPEPARPSLPGTGLADELIAERRQEAQELLPLDPRAQRSA